MPLSFSELFIYLLPGVLAFWVFKRSVQENLDNRNENTQIAISLLFGLLSLALLSFVHYALIPLGEISEYISPYAISLIMPREGNETQLFLFGNLKFWTSYFTLWGLSLLVGMLCAWIREKGWGPTTICSNFVNNRLHRTHQTPSESSLVSLIDGMTEKNCDPSLIKIYSLGGDKPLFGWFNGYSESSKEMSLDLLEYCDDISALNELIASEPRKCVVNYAVGFVIEFIEVDEKRAEEIRQTLFNSF